MVAVVTPADPIQTTNARIEARLQKIRLKPATAVALVAALIVLVGDSQALALIPLMNTMSIQYGLTPGEASLVLSILGIIAAGAVPVLTRIAERISLRNFLIIGMALTALGNGVCALAPGFTLLLVGRSVLGLSAAMPISLALVREKSEDALSTNKALAMVTAAVGVGVAFSFLLGGTVLKLNGGVHTVFWIMAGLGAATLLLAWLIVPDYRLQAKERVDYLGAALLIVGLTLVAVAISYSEAWGMRALYVFLLGLVVVVVWVAVELRVKAPMIDIRRAFRRTTVPAYILSGLFAAVAIISNLAVTSYAEFAPIPGVPGLEYGYGYIVLMASMFLMPTGFFILVGGFVLGRIITRIGVKTSLFIASGLTLVGFGFMALGHTQIWQNALGMALWGIAYALGSTAANAAFLHAAKDSEASMFSAACTTISGTCSSLAAPIFTAVLYAFAVHIPVEGKLTAVPSATSYSAIWIVLAALGLVMLVLTALHKQVDFQGGTVAAVDAAGEQTAVADAAEGGHIG